MKRIILFSLSVAALFVSGCSTPSASNSASTPPAAAPESPAPAKAAPTAFEGSWKGREATPGREGPASLAVSGQSLEFHGAEANDWLKGTFTLREDTNPKLCIGIITDCSDAQYVGKKFYAIYRIEDGTMTISGNEPGNTDIPSTFDAPGTREIIFKHDQ
jgi:uncharacterized protein (TIGR03067 family)